jgi:hypothetical protein
MLTVVEENPGTTFTTGKREELFDVSRYAGGVRSWDLTRDGTRFVMIRTGAGGGETSELTVVENFFAELAARKAR